MPDIAYLRADRPGMDSVLQFNNAGLALPPGPIVDAVSDHLRREAAIGGYEAAAKAADRIADVYDAVATLIGASPEEIAPGTWRSIRFRSGQATASSPRGPSTCRITSHFY